MSEVLIEVKKYGQITIVSVNGKECYRSATVPKYEAEHIKSFMMFIGIDNFKVEVQSDGK